MAGTTNYAVTVPELDVLMKEVIDRFLDEFPEAKKQLGKDMKGTPTRFIETLRNMFRGYKMNESILEKLLEPVYICDYKGMVVQKNIVAHSLCPHHLLPIKYGFAIGYIPRDGKAVGLSKLAHLCGFYSVRPHLQEKMTVNIVEALEKYLNPKGSGIVVIGRHDCILLGGGETHAPEVKGLNSTTRDNVYNITAELRGEFNKETTKVEFYAQIQDWLDNKGGI